MANKRKKTRRDTVLYLPVLGSDTDSELGRLIDLSADGALLLAERVLPPGEPLAVTILLPDAIAADSPRLDATVTPRWSRPDYNPANILNGCSLDVADDDRQRLRNLMEHYSFGSGQIDLRERYEISKIMAEKER